MKELNYDDIAGMIDHAVLKPNATDKDVKQGAAIALKYNVASLCIRPTDVLLAGPLLEGSDVKLSTVIGFPHGAELINVKMDGAKHALYAGVSELDVVLNIGQLLTGRNGHIREEVRQLTDLVHSHGQKIKIIFENCYLEESHIKTACGICNDAGVDWVKTSTGFGPGGALEADVRIMREFTLPDIGVKASGGIKTLDDLLLFRSLGCSRIGSSATVEILDDLKSRNEA